VDFLFVLIEPVSLSVTVEALQANIDCKSAFLQEWGQFDPTFQVQGVIPTNHHSVGKQFTRLADGETDKRMKIS